MDEDKVYRIEKFAKLIKVSVFTLRKNWPDYGGEKVGGILFFTMRRFHAKGKENERV